MDFKKAFVAGFLAACSLGMAGCIKPGDDEYSRAMSEYGKGNYGAAIELFAQAAEQECTYSKEIIYSMMANAYLAQRKFSEAAECLQIAAEGKPDYRIITMLGSVRHSAGDDEGAESAFLEAIALGPKQPEAYGSLGSLYLSQGKFQEAVEQLKKAESINTRLAVVHANLAVAYAGLKDEKSAQEQLRLAEENKCENLERFKLRVHQQLLSQ